MVSSSRIEGIVYIGLYSSSILRRGKQEEPRNQSGPPDGIRSLNPWRRLFIQEIEQRTKIHCYRWVELIFTACSPREISIRQDLGRTRGDPSHFLFFRGEAGPRSPPNDDLENRRTYPAGHPAEACFSTLLLFFHSPDYSTLSITPPFFYPLLSPGPPLAYSHTRIASSSGPFSCEEIGGNEARSNSNHSLQLPPLLFLSFTSPPFFAPTRW